MTSVFLLCLCALAAPVRQTPDTVRMRVGIDRDTGANTIIRFVAR